MAPPAFLAPAALARCLPPPRAAAAAATRCCAAPPPAPQVPQVPQAPQTSAARRPLSEREPPGVHAARLARLSRAGDLEGLDAAVEVARTDGFVLNAVNFTALAHARIVAGKGEAALVVLKEMCEAGVAPRNATLSVGVKAAGMGEGDAVESVRWLLEWWTEAAVEDGEARTWNMALGLVGRQCRVVKARDITEREGLGPGVDAESDRAWAAMMAVYKMMRERGGVAGEDGVVRVPVVDNYTENTILGVCRRRCDVRSALGVFGRMCAGFSVAPDLVSYNTMLAMLVDAAVQDLSAGERLVAFIRLLKRRMAEDGVRPDCIMHTLLLQVVTYRHRDFTPAMAVAGVSRAREESSRESNAAKSRVQDLVNRGLEQLQKGALVASLPGWESPEEAAVCAAAEATEAAESSKTAATAGIDSTELLRSIYSERAGSLIRGLWRTLPIEQRRDQRFYNMLIAAFARVGDTPGAVFALREMRDKCQLDPDLYTYNALLSAASHAGDVKLAHRLLVTLKKHRHYAPDAFSYSAALAACRRDVLESTRILEDAVAAGVAVTPPMLNAALLCYGGEVERALAVWNSWRALDTHAAAAAHVQVYRALMRSAGMAGRPDSALKLLFAGKKHSEVDPTVSLGLYGAFMRGLREGGQLHRVRGNMISSQYLKHLQLECRAFDIADRDNIPVERVRIKW